MGEYSVESFIFYYLGERNMNREQRRAIKRKSPKAPSIQRFDKLTEAQQIQVIKRIRPDFKLEDLQAQFLKMQETN